MTDVCGLIEALGHAVEALPREAIPGALGELERVRAQAWHRLTTPGPAPCPAPSRLLLTAAEVASELGVPETWIRDRARCGKVRSVRLGHYVRFDREQVLADVQRLGGSPQDSRSRKAGKRQQRRGAATTLLPGSGLRAEVEHA